LGTVSKVIGAGKAKVRDGQLGRHATAFLGEILASNPLLTFLFADLALGPHNPAGRFQLAPIT